MKGFLIILISLLISLSIFAQEIAGPWHGTIDAGVMKLQLVFNIAEQNKSYSATMDSPDQAAFGIPVDVVTFEEGVLKIEVSAAKIKYQGEYQKDHTFKGEFNQAGNILPLHLKNGEPEKTKLNRPQEPKAPFDYSVEDVVFKNEQANINLAGTLTMPKKGKDLPAVVLISGSGPQDRNQEIMGHKPFLVLADYFTKMGIAILRFDDRGTAESEGDFQIATSVDFAGDVVAARNYLKTRKEINSKKVGLIGHSEGGYIAPIIAAVDKEIAFVVSLAGPGIPGKELLPLQIEAVGEGAGMSDKQIEAYTSVNKGAYEIAIQENPEDTISARLERYLKVALKENPEVLEVSGTNETEYIKQTISQLNNPWMRFFLIHDPAPILKSVSCPFLAVNGENDLQVPSEINLKAIEEGLKLGNNESVTIKEFRNLNHLFQKSSTGNPSEYVLIEETFSPDALEFIGNWIEEITKD